MLLERKCHQRRLKDNLSRGTHYILVPEIAWDLLIQWYGLSEKSTYIARLGLFVSNYEVHKIETDHVDITMYNQYLYDCLITCNM